MKELSKAEETARCEDTITRLILAFRGLDKHDRSGRTKLERELEEEKSKLLSLSQQVTGRDGSPSPMLSHINVNIFIPSRTAGRFRGRRRCWLRKKTRR